MNKEHVVVIVGGLDSGVRQIELGTKHWERSGLKTLAQSIVWKDGEDFLPKLQRLLQVIDNLKQQENIVDLVGTSAGGVAVVCAFGERMNEIGKVITVCSRLRVGPTIGLSSFQKRTESSPAFAQAIKLFEGREGGIDKRRIMTVTAKYGDELVPSSTSTLDGATNITIPWAEHVSSIALALTVFSRPLINFLMEER